MMVAPVTCPAPGEPLPNELIIPMLQASGWDEEYIQDGYWVARCESNWITDVNINPYQTNGSATGMFQIHYYPWVPWAYDNYGWEGDLMDPLQNAQLAWLIVQYDIERNQVGQQWTCWS